MLKRYQVLFPDWLEEFIQAIVEKYDFSFSEIIRAMVCSTTISLISTLYPDYEPDISLDRILKQLETGEDLELERDQMHQILSKLYFETRKAIEYRSSFEDLPAKKD
jgi:hypothetical protein